jgi:uncharacterized protein with NRDE domain
MCTLAIYFKVAPGWPAVIAANRDEFLDRPASGPTTLCENPRVIGGKDLRAGGTWLGINEFGVVAGLLNRRSASQARADARSRGLLCLDVLRRRSAREAAEFARSQRAGDYNPFNLLIASRDAAFVAYNRGAEIDLVELTPGLHMLTNLDVDDFECPKISRAYERFAALGARDQFRADALAMRHALASLLADHETQLDSRQAGSDAPRANALCLHLDSYGTRCSSLIFLGAAESRIAHFFAPGAPCRTPYEAAPVPSSQPGRAAHAPSSR